MPVRRTFAFALLLVLTLTLGVSVAADTFQVTNLDADEPGSLLQAILDANAANGPDVIQIDAALVGEIMPPYRPIVLGNVEILGPGADQLTIRGGLDFFSGNQVVVEGLTITGGVNVNGGGIYFDSGNLELRGVRLVGNLSGSNGGGLYLENGTTAVVTNSEIASNLSQSSGGGIYSNGDSMDLEGCAIHSNEALLWGGGIAADLGTVVALYETTLARNVGIHAAIHTDGQLTLYQVTVAQNVSNGGAVYANSVGNIAGTIISDNEGDDCDEVLGVEDQNNLSSDLSCGFDGPSDLRGVDAELLPLLEAGGTTPTLVPRPDSPVIDRGSGAWCITVDQRGFARPVDGDGDEVATCDMGAVEYTPGIDDLWEIHSDGFESGGLMAWSSVAP